MAQQQRDYAAAGRVMGYGDARIIFRHLLPNAITPVLVFWMTDMALAILLGSSLGYLGLGAQPPTAEWGVLIADGKNFMTTAWWISIFPGLRSCSPASASACSAMASPIAACGGDERALLWRSATCAVRDRLRRSRSTASIVRRWTPARCWASSASPARARASRCAPSCVCCRRARRRAARRAGVVATCSACRRASSDAVRGREIAMIFQEPMTALDPGAADRPADHRESGGASRDARRGGAAAGDRTAGSGRHPGCQAAARRLSRTNSPAACASAR